MEGTEGPNRQRLVIVMDGEALTQCVIEEACFNQSSERRIKICVCVWGGG